MSQGLESPSPTRIVTDNVVALSHAGTDKSETRSFVIRATLAGFASGALRDGSEQWFQSFLAQLGPGESLSLRVAFDESSGLSFGATASAPPAAIEARVGELEQALREVIASAAPHFKLAMERTVGTVGLPCKAGLRPAGQRVCLDDLVSRRPRAMAGSKAIASDEAHLALHLASAPERRPIWLPSPS